MSELEPHNPQSDPIAALHRMSRTAGVGGADYVAINIPAVFAAILGAATALAVPWLIFLPLAGLAIICGGVALWQIRRSNGTQGGRGIAIGGIVLAVALAATAIGMAIAREAALGRDRQAMNRIIEQVGQAVAKDDYSAAYACFDSVFQQAIPLADFERRWRMQQSPETGGGRLILLQGNNIFEFATSGADRVARTKAIIHLEKAPEPGRISLEFHQSGNGPWQLRRLGDLFDPTPRRRAGQ